MKRDGRIVLSFDATGSGQFGAAADKFYAYRFRFKLCVKSCFKSRRKPFQKHVILRIINLHWRILARERRLSPSRSNFFNSCNFAEFHAETIGQIISMTITLFIFDNILAPASAVAPPPPPPPGNPESTTCLRRQDILNHNVSFFYFQVRNVKVSFSYKSTVT